MGQTNRRTSAWPSLAVLLAVSFSALQPAVAADSLALGNRSLSGVLSPPAPTRNNPSHFHEGGVGSDQGDSDQQQVAAP